MSYKSYWWIFYLFGLDKSLDIQVLYDIEISWHTLIVNCLSVKDV